MIFLYIFLAILAIIALFFLFLYICGLFVNPNKEYEDDSKFYRFLLYSTTALAIKILRIKIHTTGMEKIPTDTLPLFVGNHISNYDPILQWHVLKKWNPAFISKKANFSVPFYGRIIRRCCFLGIDRESPKKALLTINKAARLIKKGEVSIGVYPEGTRSKNCKLLPLHSGVFLIAQKACVPIVVIATRGTETIHKNYPFRRSDVYFDIVDVIPVEELKAVKTDIIGERVKNKLLEKLDGIPLAVSHEKELTNGN